MVKLFTSLKRLIGRVHIMPTFKTKEWNNIKFKPIPKDWLRSVIGFVPYFWGNDINLNLSIRFPQKKGFHLVNFVEFPNEKCSYYWEICNKNKKVVLEGENILDFSPLKHNQLDGTKLDAIVIGEDKDLDEGKYKLYIKFKKGKEEIGKRIYFGSFSVRNREDYLSSNIPAFIAVIISVIALLVR
jgi:hypothetical protein